MNNKNIDVTREFLIDIENENANLCFGINNLELMIESIEDVFFDQPKKESFIGAMWCTFNQIQNCYAAMTELVDREYSRLRGERND